MTKTLTTHEVEVTGLVTADDLRAVLEGLFNNHPVIREEINRVWAMVETMDKQSDLLAKTVGYMSESIIALKQQRDEQIALNAMQWDDGYKAGEMVGAFLQGHEELSQDTVRAILADHILESDFAYVDDADVDEFTRALMAGEFTLDEGEMLSHLVRMVAKRREEEAEDIRVNGEVE